MKMVKNISILLLLAMLCSGFAFFPHSFPNEADITAESVILINADTGEILYEMNANASVFPSGVINIMTCLVALEHGNLDEQITVSTLPERGTMMGLSQGETLSLRSLLYGLMMVGGIDAADTIATHIGGTQEAFVQMMNSKAREIGMTNSTFTAPDGIYIENAPNTQTTAKDFATLSQYALKQSAYKDVFREIVSAPTYTVTDSSAKQYDLKSMNKLLYTRTTESGELAESYEYEGAIGIKTGTTRESTYCLAAAAERDGKTMIAVIFNAVGANTQFVTASQLFDWGLN